MLKYEYLTITRRNTDSTSLDALELNRLLNYHAKDGWWLFAVYPTEDKTVERVVFERVQEKIVQQPQKSTRTLN